MGRALKMLRHATYEGVRVGRLENKAAIVTGAGSGIGKAIAHLFTREGALVVSVDLTGAEQDTAREIGPTAAAVRADVSNADDMQSMIGTVIARHHRIDVLVNNAGIEGDQAR